MIDDPLNRLKVLRGSQLSHSKLNEDDVSTIRQLIAHRDSLRQQASNLTNKKLAEKYDVHCRTIDRISAGENWCHVD